MGNKREGDAIHLDGRVRDVSNYGHKVRYYLGNGIFVEIDKELAKSEKLLRLIMEAGDPVLW